MIIITPMVSYIALKVLFRSLQLLDPEQIDMKFMKNNIKKIDPIVIRDIGTFTIPISLVIPLLNEVALNILSVIIPTIIMTSAKIPIIIVIINSIIFIISVNRFLHIPRTLR